MRILVYEHVSGGGFADEAIPTGFLGEGYGMLRTIISDFKAAGHYVSTLLDSRIAKLNPPLEADCIVPVFSSQEARANLRKISDAADAAYVIAPETDGLLRSLVEVVEQTDAASLNCPARVMDKVSDKAVFNEFMRARGLTLPETRTFNIVDDLKEIKQTVQGSLNFPLIFKPPNGVSCCGLSIVKNEEQVADAVCKIKRESSSKHFVAQELISGAAASVSLFSTGSDVVPICLNRQEVTIETSEACSRYNGGSVPFDHPLKSKAFEVAEKIGKLFPDLRGYVGVDFVLTEDEAVAIEVNPRLTTSYIGLRRVVNFNPAQAIVNAVLKRELPARIQSCGCAYFSKLETLNPQIDALQKTYGMNDVVSPPLFVSENGAASMLIISRGTTPQEAESRLREAKKRILNTINRGK